VCPAGDEARPCVRGHRAGAPAVTCACGRRQAGEAAFLGFAPRACSGHQLPSKYRLMTLATLATAPPCAPRRRGVYTRSKRCGAPLGPQDRGHRRLPSTSALTALKRAQELAAR